VAEIEQFLPILERLSQSRKVSGMIQRDEQVGRRAFPAYGRFMRPRARPLPRERAVDYLPSDVDNDPLARRRMICYELPTLSRAARDIGPSSLCLSILAWAQYRERDVVQILVCAEEMKWTAGRPESLNAVLARVRMAKAVSRIDTLGHVAAPETRPWADFVTLAEPHIRFAVRASGCRGPEDIEECVQEAWLQVVQCVDRVNIDPGRGSLACWLQTLARRSACRHLRRQARAAATPRMLVKQFPGLHNPEVGDPLQPDPAVVCAACESLAICFDALPKGLGVRALDLVRLYMEGQCSLTGLAPQFDMTPGQFWHLWRTVKAFLRDRLEPMEA
jgi:RNA polymerase sigma factor (sigma-70 family)